MAKGSNAHVSGQSFLAGVLAKLPEAARAQVESVFGSDDAVAALEVIGTGALAQPEINRRLDELKARTDALTAKEVEVNETFTKQTDWWNTNKVKVEEYDKLKAGGSVVPSNGAPVDVEALRKEMDAKISDLSLQGAGLMALMTNLSVKHFREFGVEPDMSALLADKNLGKQLPDGRIYNVLNAYETKYGEEIKARAAAEEQKRIDKLVDEKFKERMKGADQPFPLRGQNPSVLDMLEDPNAKPENHTVDTAAALYEQLQAARG